MLRSCKNSWKCVVTTLLILFCLLNSAPAMEIVTNGQGRAVIVVAKDAPKMVSFAASEMQAYLEKISGAKLIITSEKPASGNVIYVGESVYTRQLGLSTKDLKSDGFRIISGKGWLALFGRESEPSYGSINPSTYPFSYSEKTGISKYGETGSLFAVYRFLENNCGMHWYMPGDLGEIVPKSSEIKVGKIDYTKWPDFSYRNMYYDAFSVAGGDEALWYRRAGFGAAYPVTITHSFFFLNKYAKDHPEYFALLDGERDFDKTCVGKGSLCLSEPGTLAAFVADACKYFDDNPGANIYPVMPNDGWERKCECPRCRNKTDKSMGSEGEFSDYLWDFVNKVAIEVEKTHPGKLIGCCAYEHYLKPPKNIKKLNSNVAVMICKMRYLYWNKKYKSDMNALIDDWKKKTDHIDVWEYYLFASGYDIALRGLPVFFPSITAQDLRHLKGISGGEFVEAESWLPGLAESQTLHRPELITPNLYITGKLYWDTSLDPERLMDQYCKDMYGPAQGEMRSFWKNAEHLWSDVDVSKRKGESLAGPEDCARLYTPDRLNTLLSYLNKAAAKTRENTLESKRIDLLKSEVEPAVKRMTDPQLTTRPRLSVPYAGVPPAIDGNPDDACWKSAAKLNFSDDIMGGDAAYKTHASILWDDKNLYLAFVNDEPNTAGMVLRQSKKDASAIWDDESMEMFFEPQAKTAGESEYYQFIINANGVVWDAHFKEGVAVPTDWDSNCTVKTKIENGKWTLEAAIPLDSMGLGNLNGKTVTANFYRSRSNGDTGGEEWSAWFPAMSCRFYEPSRFGYLDFTENGRPAQSSRDKGVLSNTAVK